MKYSVIEANMTELQHSVINRQILSMILGFKDTENVNLYCSDSHYEALRMKSEKLYFKNLIVLKPGKFRILKFFLEFFQVIKILKQSNDDLVILLSCFPNVHYFLTLLSKFYKNKVLIITHGEAEGLIDKSKYWKFWSYPFWIYKTFSLPVKQNVYRLVLGKSIYNNFSKMNLLKNIYFIEHPYEGFKDINKIIPNGKGDKFAYIGNCLAKKGGDAFIDASKKSIAEFIVIGAYDLGRKDYNDNLLVLSENHQMLSYEDFNNAIENVTYACYPYARSSYRFTASGAIFDAIKYLKPIIYIRNDYFDSIFNGAGDIGYCCDSVEDFIKTVEELTSNYDVKRYELQVKNLKKLQEQFKVDCISKSLLQVIYSIVKS